MFPIAVNIYFWIKDLKWFFFKGDDDLILLVAGSYIPDDG